MNIILTIGGKNGFFLFYHLISSDLLQQISVSGSILLTSSRVSNEPIMNPGGQRGSKSMVNLMRIG